MASPTMQINENDGVWRLHRTLASRPGDSLCTTPSLGGGGGEYRYMVSTRPRRRHRFAPVAAVAIIAGSPTTSFSSDDGDIRRPGNIVYYPPLRNRQNSIVLLLIIMISQKLTLPCHVPKYDNDLLRQLGRPILTLLVMILLARNNNNINSFDNVARVWEVLSNRQF